MASKSYVLLINNIIARDTDNSIIFESFERGQRMYKNSKTNADVEGRVQQLLVGAIERDKTNALYEHLRSEDVLTRVNHEFKLKMLITPLYDLQIQLATNTELSRQSGSSVDLRVLFNKQVASFYALEFYKYSQIMALIEGIVRKNRPANSPFTIHSGKNRIMSLVHVQVSNLFNPIETLKDLKVTKLFRELFTQEEFEIDSLDSPTVFKFDIMRGEVPCYFATSSDILALCNIDHKEELTSANLYRLIAGICLKNLFAGDLDRMNVNSVLSFPVNKRYYEVYDEIMDTPINYYSDFRSAQNAIEGTEYVVNELDTDAIFVSTAFPSFRKRAVSSETPLLRKVRGAEFVNFN